MKISQNNKYKDQQGFTLIELVVVLAGLSALAAFTIPNVLNTIKLNKIEEAKRYKDPKQFETWVYNQPNQLDQYRMIVLENQLVEKLDNDLKSKDKVINFKDLSKY